MPGWGVGAAEAKVTDPTWKHKPSYYLVARDDQMLPEPLQRRMAERAGMDITEAPGSHAVHVSQPDAVADLVRRHQSADHPAACVGHLGGARRELSLRGPDREAGLAGRQ